MYNSRLQAVALLIFHWSVPAQKVHFFLKKPHSFLFPNVSFNLIRFGMGSF